MRSPGTSPPAGRGGPLGGPTIDSVVRQRYSGPSSDSPAADVTIFTFEAALSDVFSARAYSVLPLSASTTIAEIFAFANGFAPNSSSSWLFSHSRRWAGSLGGLGRSGDGPGRGVTPSSGRGPPLAGGPSVSVGAGAGCAAGGAPGGGAGGSAASRARAIARWRGLGSNAK